MIEHALGEVSARSASPSSPPRPTLFPAGSRAKSKHRRGRLPFVYRQERRGHPEPVAHAPVTVLIPAHNEAASIGRTLASLQRQTFKPHRIIVIADNCNDPTEGISKLCGAEIYVTERNTNRKAGAVNQLLELLLPVLADDEFVLVMDADSYLDPNWIKEAVSVMRQDPEVGGVCGTYRGDPRDGFLYQLQRNEFVRASRLVARKADLWVLSGTGTLFRVAVLREVADARGSLLPGKQGTYYRNSSITEDYEITLALKTLGYKCLAPPGCTASTELMPTWQLLFRQRLRWQSGTLTALRQYGITKATWRNWLLQAFFYVRYISQLIIFSGILYTLVAGFGAFMPWWILVMLGIIYIERLVTVIPAGRQGMLLVMLLLPEWVYGLFDGLYLFEALRREIVKKEVGWSHLGGRS